MCVNSCSKIFFNSVSNTASNSSYNPHGHKPFWHFQSCWRVPMDPETQSWEPVIEFSHLKLHWETYLHHNNVIDLQHTKNCILIFLDKAVVVKKNIYLTVSGLSCCMRDPSSLTRDWTQALCNGPPPGKVAQTVKCLPTMRETGVQSLGWEDLLEKEMATNSSIFAWKIPRREEPGGLQSMGSQRVGHDWVTSFSLVTFLCSGSSEP